MKEYIQFNWQKTRIKGTLKYIGQKKFNDAANEMQKLQQALKQLQEGNKQTKIMEDGRCLMEDVIKLEFETFSIHENPGF